MPLCDSLLAGAQQEAKMGSLVPIKKERKILCGTGSGDFFSLLPAGVQVGAAGQHGAQALDGLIDISEIGIQG